MFNSFRIRRLEIKAANLRRRLAWEPQQLGRIHDLYAQYVEAGQPFPADLEEYSLWLILKFVRSDDAAAADRLVTVLQTQGKHVPEDVSILAGRRLQQPAESHGESETSSLENKAASLRRRLTWEPSQLGEIHDLYAQYVEVGRPFPADLEEHFLWLILKFVRSDDADAADRLVTVLQTQGKPVPDDVRTLAGRSSAESPLDLYAPIRKPGDSKMGINLHVASIVIREHAWKPIRGDVLLLGRQSMFFSPRDAIDLMQSEGLSVPNIDFGMDISTRQASANQIRDDDFFRLLGVPKIRALDVSDYEGADIVHDLTAPLPSHLEGIADFILDGSTLDNVFDPAAALRNMARLLKPGGRLVSVNVGSNHFGPYTIPTPFWLLDYFVYNAFADCKVYIQVYSPQGVNCFTPNLNKLTPKKAQANNPTSGHVMGLAVMAEKGDRSTWDRNPIQLQYRNDWDAFSQNIEVIKSSARPEFAKSTTDRFLDFADDYLFIDQQGTIIRSPLFTTAKTIFRSCYREVRAGLRRRTPEAP